MPRTLPRPVLDAGFCSWTALAVAAGLSRMHVVNVRSGRKPLTAGVRAKLAAALGIPEGTVDLVLMGEAR